AIRTASVTLAFPSIAAGGGTQSLTTTITGAAVGDTVIVNRAGGSMPDAGTLLDAAVTSANTVTIRDTNITSAAITPISTTYRITVISY
ncbi:MAG: hypothetical protein KGL39_59180, partial [Patescibacteria group bacterium]|nr:hypothetical protein [Patescibacteria group bacterium]